MPKRNTQNTIKQRARALKRAGVIDYDLRRTLTPGQKAAITRAWRGTGRGVQSLPWGRIVSRDDIVRRTVSPKKAKLLRQLGYAVAGRRVFIDTEGHPEVHIRGNKIIKSGRGKKEIVDFIVDKENLLATLKRLSGTKLPPNEFLTVKIGNNAAFRRRFVSYSQLLRYLSHWKPKKDFNMRDDLINQRSPHPWG